MIIRTKSTRSLPGAIKRHFTRHDDGECLQPAGQAIGAEGGKIRATGVALHLTGLRPGFDPSTVDREPASTFPSGVQTAVRSMGETWAGLSGWS